MIKYLKRKVFQSGATVDFSVSVYLITGDHKKPIYNACHEYGAKVIWINDRTLNINGKILDVTKDTYDWQKMRGIKALCGIIIILITLLLLSSCNDSSDSNQAIVGYNGNKYEQYSGGLLPSGNLYKTASMGDLSFYDVKTKQLSESEEVTVQIYENDKNNIFITISGKGLLDTIHQILFVVILDKIT